MKLFLLPFAGGSAVSYFKWKPYLADGITMIPLELAGRGRRHGVPFSQSMKEAVDDLFEALLEHLEWGEPYAIYGHSMGAMLAFELYYTLLEYKRPLPVQLFVSGCRAPHIRKDRPDISHLPDDLLKEELRKLGGTPAEVLNSKELMDYCLPIIRADFRILEDYRFEKKRVPMTCGVALFGGTSDEISRQELLQWEVHTKGGITLDMFPGDHFFINHVFPDIARAINNRLASCRTASSKERLPNEDDLEVFIS
jgi:medium-chain acyl-[acyl-carrier-protein] hydrolase